MPARRPAHPVARHLMRLGGALAVTAVLLGPSAQAGSSAAAPTSRLGPGFTPVPGHGSSEWLMMGLHCGASLS